MNSTPNDDGLNDSFYPIDVPERYIKSFQIFNQWGNIVYDMEKDGYINDNGLKGWDGGKQAGIWANRLGLGPTG